MDDAVASDANVDPAICYINEKDSKIEALETKTEGNVISATVTHFSKYTLVDRKVLEKAGKWIDRLQLGDGETMHSSVELVFVIDDSGSMDSNDPYYKRLDVAKDVINMAPQNAKVGVVRFESYTQILTSSLTTKEAAASYLTRQYFTSPGGTAMYDGIYDAVPLFSTPATDDTVLRMMVVLSDGNTFEDSHSQKEAISAAQGKNIKVYTIGLGSSSYLQTYFTNFMKPISDKTGGQFFLVDKADQLKDAFGKIGESINITVDSDGDGIPDFYEDNMVSLGGKELKLDKNNPDTDGDGYLDGEEIQVFIYYDDIFHPEQIMIIGKMISDPTDPSSTPKAA